MAKISIKFVLGITVLERFSITHQPLTIKFLQFIDGFLTAKWFLI